MRLGDHERIDECADEPKSRKAATEVLRMNREQTRPRTFSGARFAEISRVQRVMRPKLGAVL